MRHPHHAALLSLAATLALSGCAGHGKYTSEHKTQSQEKVAKMKSATEWDLSRQAYLAGDLDKALKHVDRSVAYNEEVTKTHVLRGRILMELNDFQGSLAAFARAEEIDPDDVDTQYFTGLCHERIAQKEKALARYQRAGELEPGRAQYAVAAAEMLIDLGRLDEGEEHLRSRGETFENNPGVKQTLGHIAMLRGNAEGAVDLFTEARLLAPDDSAVLEDLARAQLAAGRFADAEYSLSHLLTKPENASRRDLRHAQARCLLQVGRPVEARDILIALTSDAQGTKDVEAWIELGHTCYVVEDITRLKQCASRVVAIAPQRHEGYLLKALWEKLSGNPEAALVSLGRALERRPDDVQTLLLRGVTAHECGMPDLARECFAQAQALEPGNAVIAGLLNAVEAGAAYASEPPLPGPDRP